MFRIYKDNHKIIIKLLWFKISFNNPYAMKNNSIIFIDQNGNEINKTKSKIKGLNIKFEGSNNKITIYLPNKFLNSKIVCTNNCTCIIERKDDGKQRNLDIRLCGENSNVKIGKNFNCGSLLIFAGSEPNTSLTIGDDCLFSSNVECMTCDGHRIYDVESNEDIKTCGDIKIGNHVWVGTNVMFLKNSEIPNNCIVRCNSLINKKFIEENTVYAGVPCKKIKSGINWSEKFCNK